MDAELQQQINQYADQIAHGGPAHLYAKLAEAYRKAGRMQEAAHTARTGLEKHPESLLIQESLGLCLLDMGEATAAVRALAPVVEKLPENATAAIALAIALSRINRSQEAVKVLQRRLNRDPLDQKARLLLQQLDGSKPEPAAARPEPEKEKPKEEILPLPIPEGADQTDVAFVVRSAGALFDAVPMTDTDVVVDMRQIFDDKPRPKPAETAKPPAPESAPVPEPTPSVAVKPEIKAAAPAPKKVEEKPTTPPAPSAPPVASSERKTPPAVEKPAEKKTVAAAPAEKPAEKKAPASEKAEEEKSEITVEDIRPAGFFQRIRQWLTGSKEKKPTPPENNPAKKAGPDKKK